MQIHVIVNGEKVGELTEWKAARVSGVEWKAGVQELSLQVKNGQPRRPIQHSMHTCADED
jgi:hypothetical protein